MSKSRHSSKFDDVVHDLVAALLKISDQDGDFIITTDYVISSIIHHRCLDVYSLAIERSLQGILLKMHVHGQRKKAERMKELAEQFLSSPYLQDKGDLKWSLIYFLISLGRHPARDGLSSTNINDGNDFFESEGSVESDEWMQELMRRSFHLIDKDETLSEWSDDEETRCCNHFSLGSEDIQIENNIKDHMKQDKNYTKDKIALIKEEFSIAKRDITQRKNSLIKESQLATSWLNNSLQRPYWVQEHNDGFSNTEKINNNAMMMLTEYVVMRECLWTLLAPSSGFVFQLNGENFEINSVVISCLSQASLKHLLSTIAASASKLLAIDKWLKDTPGMGQRDFCNRCGTISSYADGLRRWRHYFDAQICQLEKEIYQQTETRTLLWLLHALDPLLLKLSIIHQIHTKGFFNSSQYSSLNQSLKLISLLVKSVESGYGAPERAFLLTLLEFALKNHMRALQFILWDSSSHFETCLAEFGIQKKSVKKNDSEKIEEVVYEANRNIDLDLRGLKFLKDLQKPLIDICQLRGIVHDLDLSIEKDPSYLVDLISKTIKEKFYNANYNYSEKLYSRSNNSSTCQLNDEIKAKETQFDSKSKLQMNNEVSMSCIKTENIKLDSENGDFDEINRNDNFKKTKSNIPNSILLKDMEGNGFEKTDKDDKIRDKNLETGEPGIREIINVKKGNEDNKRLETENQINNAEDDSGRRERKDVKIMNDKISADEIQENTNQRKERILIGNLMDDFEVLEEDIYLEAAIRDEEATSQVDDYSSLFSDLESFHSANGLEYLLTKSLLPLVQNRYNEMSRNVIRSLVENHGLMFQLRMFKAVFLLEPYARMNDFYSYLFHSIDCDDLPSGIEMTQNLQVCLSERRRDWASYFDVSVKENIEGNHSPVHLFQSLSINMTELWPLTQVINSFALEKYNQLLSFCLMLRRATFSLEELRFREIGSYEACYLPSHPDDLDISGQSDADLGEQQPSLPLSQLVHQLQLLRQWFLYLVGTLHHHFATAAIIPFSHYVDELVNVECFEVFLQEHKRLLDEVCRRCLLSDKVVSLQNVFSKVFSAVENVRELWLGSPNKISKEKLVSLQDQYTMCHRFIANFFSALSQNHFIPLVDGLAQCLSYNRPT